MQKLEAERWRKGKCPVRCKNHSPMVVCGSARARALCVAAFAERRLVPQLGIVQPVEWKTEWESMPQVIGFAWVDDFPCYCIY